ncbi:3-dehydroquinate dehydratase, type II [Melioribacter roseus P3M-2]|uniref:3-dehydroquinate dehydratase n=1 Tax=Melioribacter roseus (strain DSM 23840 / JCM 17771 / VKM B-2668 / P3M-2) TaxID=1191523 RepID=I7A777_MELRP|nr:type II 3-dehydroquinate dehydratase [Melioribacter roseus]AFN75741.1 3-dehydroquinate dehydratase, type II [Melioribacter roseus P3M-2]
MKILVINGPNLNLLKLRNPDFYGNNDLKSIEDTLRRRFPDIEFVFFQSPDESNIVKRINEPAGFDGILINPGGYSHTSVAIRDALEICPLPKVEVHLSNIQSRDSFRKVSLTASVCDGYISGFKTLSYILGVHALIDLIGK